MATATIYCTAAGFVALDDRTRVLLHGANDREECERILRMRGIAFRTDNSHKDCGVEISVPGFTVMFCPK